MILPFFLVTLLTSEIIFSGFETTLKSILFDLCLIEHPSCYIYSYNSAKIRIERKRKTCPYARLYDEVVFFDAHPFQT